MFTSVYYINGTSYNMRRVVVESRQLEHYVWVLVLWLGRYYHHGCHLNICMVTFDDGVLLIFNRANNNRLVKLVIVMPISCCLFNLIVRYLCVNCAFCLSIHSMYIRIWVMNGRDESAISNA